MHSVKKTMRLLGGRLGLRPESNAGPAIEQGAEWYDQAFQSAPEYALPYYRSHYYFMWTVIVDRIRRGGHKQVLEIGCGPGQLASYLLEQGIEQYVGLDFSPTAIAMAGRNAPAGRFVVGDARDPGLYMETNYDMVICTEVLEHVLEDTRIVSHFGVGKRCLCSVPNFPYESHVRHFQDADEVAVRYGPFFDDLDVTTFRSSTSETIRYFLLDGVRNEHRV